MQTRDAVEGFHNCREFSQLPIACLDEAWKKKSFIAFIKYLSKIIQQMKENAVFWLFIETDFLDTRSYFLPTNQNARLKIHNQSKFVWCHSCVPYSHLNKGIDQWECAYYPNFLYNINQDRCALGVEIILSKNCFRLLPWHPRHVNIKQLKSESELSVCNMFECVQSKSSWSFTQRIIPFLHFFLRILWTVQFLNNRIF